MPYKRVIFRADGNTSIGLGHLYRLNALYDYLKPLYECLVISKDAEFASAIFKDVKVFYMPEDVETHEEHEWIDNLFNSDDLIILDGYQFDSDYQRNLKKKGFKIVYIDDKIKYHMHADLVINHAMGIQNQDYNAESYTEFALGSKFSILRKAFIKASNQGIKTEKADTAFVCFGGADPFSLNELAVEALLCCNQISTINVVMGKRHARETNSAIFSDPKVYLYDQVSAAEMVDLMKASHFAIAPASTISYELCMLRIPTLLGYYVDNQLKLYHGLIKNNAAYELGDFRSIKKSALVSQIMKFLNDTEELASIKNNQIKLFDHLSELRIRKKVFSLISGNIEFRRIIENDIDKVFEWSNEKLVREQSFNTNPIDYDEHRNWFSAKLKSEDSVYFIAEIDNEEVAFIRFDTNHDETVMGISIDKKYRGLGISSDLIELGVKKYQKIERKPILAYIKSSNLASIKAFKKAGFDFLNAFLQNGVETFKFKFDKTPNE